MSTVAIYRKRLEALKSERSSFMPLYRDLSKYHLAFRGKFLASDRSKGRKRNENQINNKSRIAVRVIASGMMSGITSPARPWFRLSTGVSELNELTTVKLWLRDVQRTMYEVFSHSNTYNSLHQLYSELAVFGTAAMGVYHNFDSVIRCKPYTVGEYMLALGKDDKIDTFYREYELTVGQVIKQFGVENVSIGVKHMWDSGSTESYVTVVHVIEPNDDRDHMSPLASEKKFRSVYFENDKGNRDADKFLKKSGFDELPILSPRWDVVTDDVYATDCPGITALGDTKALQLGMKRLYQAVDIVSNPPLQAPVTMKASLRDGAPRGGSISYNDDITAGGLRSIYENYRPDLNAVREINKDAEGRISSAFYEDLFLMLASSDRRQITAREVAEKHEEKLLMLGPVLERLHFELLNPLIDRTFDILQRNGVLPPPPPELDGVDLSVKYVSVLAQAQLLVNTGALDRLTGFVGQISSIWPSARHKVNAPQAVDDYADALGVDPAIINSDSDVEAAVAAEAAQAAQAQAIEQGQQLADIAGTAATIPSEGNNVVSNAMSSAGVG